MVRCVVWEPICLPIYGKPMGNRPILLSHVGNLWHKKLTLYLNLLIDFPQLRDFLLPKNLLFDVLHRFSMSA